MPGMVWYQHARNMSLMLKSKDHNSKRKLKTKSELKVSFIFPNQECEWVTGRQGKNVQFCWEASSLGEGWFFPPGKTGLGS